MTQVGDIVSVKAGLISKSEVEPVFYYKLDKTFNKGETIIADSGLEIVTHSSPMRPKIEHW